jgi:hypothetical protein
MVPTTRRVTAAGVKEVRSTGRRIRPPRHERLAGDAVQVRGGVPARRPCASYTKSVAKMVSPCSRMFTPHRARRRETRDRCASRCAASPSEPSRATAMRPDGDVTPTRGSCRRTPRASRRRACSMSRRRLSCTCRFHCADEVADLCGAAVPLQLPLAALRNSLRTRRPSCRSRTPRSSRHVGYRVVDVPDERCPSARRAPNVNGMTCLLTRARPRCT